MCRKSLCAIACLLATTPFLRADEFRLSDGRVIVGKARTKGDDIEVSTRKGVVRFAATDVVARRTDSELVAELRKLAKMSGDSANHQLQLAKTALSFGLNDHVWRHLDRCIKKLPVERADSTSRRYAKFLATLEPEVLDAKYREAETKDRVRALLRLVRNGARPAKNEAVVELLAREPGAAEHLRFATRRQATPEKRSAALHALVRRDDFAEEQDANRAAIYRSLVMDKERDVRVETARLVREQGDVQHALRYLAPGFLHDHPSIRGRTAQAFEYLGDLAGAPYLVAAGPLAGVPSSAAGSYQGVRANMFQITTRSYIQDFEVEIAQAAAVANPVIGNAQNGVVLDVRIGGVASMRVPLEKAYRRALQQITGEDPGPNPATWSEWWLERQAPRPGQGQ